MRTKQHLITEVNNLIIKLGLSHQDLIDSWDLSDSQIDISQVKVGMIWYEDDTFSSEKIAGKKIKAIVELVHRGVIYGDLTASDILDVKEQQLTWYNAQNYVNGIPYRLRSKEWITWQDEYRIGLVYSKYESVKNAFKLIDKPCRHGLQWSSTKLNANQGWSKDFDNGNGYIHGTYMHASVRPIIARRVK